MIKFLFFTNLLFLCRETCQGQAFATASAPPTILFLELATGGTALVPQIFSEKDNIQIFLKFVWRNI